MLRYEAALRRVRRWLWPLLIGVAERSGAGVGAAARVRALVRQAAARRGGCCWAAGRHDMPGYSCRRARTARLNSNRVVPGYNLVPSRVLSEHVSIVPCHAVLLAIYSLE